MKPQNQTMLLAAMLLLLSTAGKLDGQDKPDLAAEDAAKKFQAYAKETARSYKALIGPKDDRKLTLSEQPILRWTNPLGGRNAHGEVFLWTDSGRPAAALSLY